ncbi:hypothetical protein ACHAPI_010565 [Fusarium lateritium]
MLKETDRWTIHTLMISGSAKTTLTCLHKCDPRQLTGVGLMHIGRQMENSASSSIDEEGSLTPEYKALKALYKKEDDSRDQGPLLKRLYICHQPNLIVRSIDCMKKTLDEVVFVANDFPDLEWLIVHEKDPGIPVAAFTEDEREVWEDHLEQFIAKLEGTRLVKLSFCIHSNHLNSARAHNESNGTRHYVPFKDMQWYLRLASRLVNSVEGLKDVAIRDIYSCYYRATQSRNGKIETVCIEPTRDLCQFPLGLFDAWA